MDHLSWVRRKINRLNPYFIYFLGSFRPAQFFHVEKLILLRAKHQLAITHHTLTTQYKWQMQPHQHYLRSKCVVIWLPLAGWRKQTIHQNICTPIPVLYFNPLLQSWGERRKFSREGGHWVAYAGHLYLVCALFDVTFDVIFMFPNQRFGVCWHNRHILLHPICLFSYFMCHCQWWSLETCSRSRDSSRDPILRVSVSKVSGLATLNIAKKWLIEISKI